MKFLKVIAKHILALPGISRSVFAGFRPKNFQEYTNAVSFFRYFPFGVFKGNSVAQFRFGGRAVSMFMSDEGPHKLGVFSLKEYDDLKSFIRGRDVIDLGAAFGDTAVLFGIWGAKRVFGYEINKRHVRMAERNITLNNLEGRCKVFWCGVGKSVERIDRSVTTERDMADAKTVEMVNLKHVIVQHGINGGVLKMDVDGYEYEIFNDVDEETLRKFDKIFIEFHYGEKNLVKKLEQAGFMVSVSPTTKLFVAEHPEAYQNMEVGFIDATKKERTPILKK